MRGPESRVRNASDVPVTDKSIAIVDKVTITQAAYDADAGTLTIAAQSSDTYLNPALTAAADGVAIGALSGGALTVSGLDIAPELVTVTSAVGGSDTEPVEVVGAGFAPAPVIASITVPDGDAVAPVTPSPDPDGTIVDFTIQPYTAGASVVYLDGILQTAGADYTEIDAAAGTIQFAVAPPAGSTISNWSKPIPVCRSPHCLACLGRMCACWLTRSRTMKSLPRPCILENLSFTLPSVLNKKKNNRDSYLSQIVKVFSPSRNRPSRSRRQCRQRSPCGLRNRISYTS